MLIASLSFCLSLSFFAKKVCINTYIYTYTYIHIYTNIYIYMYMRKCTSLRCSANAHKKSCSCGKKGNQAERQATLLRGNYREKRRLGSFVRPLRVCNCVPFCCFFLSIFFHITMYRNDNVYPIRMRQVRTLPCCIMVCVLKKMAGRKRHSKCFLFFFLGCWLR